MNSLITTANNWRCSNGSKRSCEGRDRRDTLRKLDGRRIIDSPRSLFDVPLRDSTVQQLILAPALVVPNGDSLDADGNGRDAASDGCCSELLIITKDEQKLNEMVTIYLGIEGESSSALPSRVSGRKTT